MILERRMVIEECARLACGCRAMYEIYDLDTDYDGPAGIEVFTETVEMPEAETGRGSRQLLLTGSGKFLMITRWSPDNWNPASREDELGVDEVVDLGVGKVVKGLIFRALKAKQGDLAVELYYALGRFGRF